MASPKKDTIYIDIDDEITGIIDKLKGSEGKVVALVLPKRAAVFQSIVNMKLLKRAADADKKHLVLITSEAGLLPLAGAAGVHVAKTLTSKPEIPGTPDMDDSEEEVTEDAEEIEDTSLDASKPIGELAGAKAAADEVETVTLDDDDLPPESDDKPAGKTFEPPKKKKDKKLAIPNFDRFRLILAAGVLGLILLITGFIFAASALPKAVISIKTNASNVDTNSTLNLSTTAKKLNEADNTLPAKLASQQKTYTQSVPTTGQKNNGNKASGSISMSAGSCSSDVPGDVPAGTGVVASSNNQTYITQETVSFVPTVSHGKCIFQGVDGGGDNGISITAQTGGTSYNTSGNFKVSGRPEISSSGSASNGTDNIVQSVNQNDINNAKAKITVNDSEIKKALNDQLKGYKVLDSTYAAGTPNVTTSANVGEVATNVTVTQVVTYTMFGVHQSDLQKIVESSVKDQIDTSQQGIIDDGLGDATFSVDNQSPTGAQVTMSARAVVGPDLDIANIREQAAGKKPGAIKGELGAIQGVESVDVKLSPFWVSSVPKKTSRITVDIAKPTSTAKASSNGNNQ